MRASLLILSFLIFSIPSRGQFEGSWYTFHIDDLSYTSITSKYLIIGRISNYNTSKETVWEVDTFTIQNKFLKNDSFLYIVTNIESDDITPNRNEFNVQKFCYHKKSNTVTAWFYRTLKNFVELQEKKKKLPMKNVERFIKADTVTVAYLTYYPIDTINAFLQYPKLIDQPKDVIVELYNKLIVKIQEVRSLPEEEQMPYALMWGMSKSAIEVPIYLKLKTCPLVKPENFEEIYIREKYKNDEEIIEVLDKYRELRNSR